MHVCDVLDSCYSLCLSKAYFRFFFSSLWSICFVVGAVVVLLLSHWLFPLLPPLHLSLSLSHVCVIKNALKNDVHHSYTFNQIHDLYTALVYARSFICPLCISLSLSLSIEVFFFWLFFFLFYSPYPEPNTKKSAMLEKQTNAILYSLWLYRSSRFPRAVFHPNIIII